jgi:hypothetical protein
MGGVDFPWQSKYEQERQSFLTAKSSASAFDRSVFQHRSEVELEKPFRRTILPAATADYFAEAG